MILIFHLNTFLKPMCGKIVVFFVRTNKLKLYLLWSVWSFEGHKIKFNEAKLNLNSNQIYLLYFGFLNKSVLNGFFSFPKIFAKIKLKESKSN